MSLYLIGYTLIIYVISYIAKSISLFTDRNIQYFNRVQTTCKAILDVSLYKSPHVTMVNNID